MIPSIVVQWLSTKRELFGCHPSLLFKTVLVAHHPLPQCLFGKKLVRHHSTVSISPSSPQANCPNQQLFQCPLQPADQQQSQELLPFYSPTRFTVATNDSPPERRSQWNASAIPVNDSSSFRKPASQAPYQGT